MAARYELTAEQWKKVEALLPGKASVDRAKNPLVNGAA